jgi:coproporphyrinogen III oxidase-like Fe-S oxidoreductase
LIQILDRQLEQFSYNFSLLLNYFDNLERKQSLFDNLLQLNQILKEREEKIQTLLTTFGLSFSDFESIFQFFETLLKFKQMLKK